MKQKTVRRPTDLLDAAEASGVDSLFQRQLLALRAGKVLFPPLPPSEMQAELLSKGTTVNPEDATHLQGGASVEDQAGALLDALVMHVEANALKPSMLKLIAQHLRAEQVRVGKNQAAMKVLGMAKPSRPVTRPAKEEAAALTFAEAVGDGCDESAAIRRAYDAYWALAQPPQSYDADLEVPRVGKHPTLAHQRMETIRAVLAKWGVLESRRPGRPKKSK
ncbi:hypothetical protein QRD43_15505 [Pelomonas sp. APW6]|uniref:DUF2293 domain-containing protein n=1 Tax=Roseateles subflavus TaxID=3053353 RepID=A0ABT7LKC2_9BURK|nr:hypothetical protein [Pelomonas sp. APW6]MDL5033321.1 hypothetical protein [Pelomonas sp. APW6]